MDQKRQTNAERQKHWRNKPIDVAQAKSNYMSEQAEVLQVLCAKCWHQFSRPHRQQQTSTIKPLSLDKFGKVEQRLRSGLRGSKPEEHVMSHGQFWICSGCHKNQPITTRFYGNLQISQLSSERDQYTLRAMVVRNVKGESFLIMAPSNFPTLDIDGNAAVLPSDISLMKSKVMVLANGSSVKAFKENFPQVFTRDWKINAKFATMQRAQPGILSIFNLFNNYHMDQIQKGLRYAEQKKEERVLGYSRTDENGTRTLHTVEFNQNTQSHEVVAEVMEKNNVTSGDKRKVIGGTVYTSSPWGAPTFEKARVEVRSPKPDTVDISKQLLKEQEWKQSAKFRQQETQINSNRIQKDVDAHYYLERGPSNNRQCWGKQQKLGRTSTDKKY